MLRREQTGPQQDDGLHVFGEALVKPKQAGVVLARVVERPENLVANALDVPGVEELMRAKLVEALVGLLILEGHAGDVERA